MVMKPNRNIEPPKFTERYEGVLPPPLEKRAKIIFFVFAILILLFAGTGIALSQEPTLPFTLNKQTGKWETSESVIRQYVKDMNELQTYRDSIVPEYKKQVELYKKASDSLIASTVSLKLSNDFLEEKNRLHSKVIDELLKPVEIKTQGSLGFSFIKHIGLFPFAGASYDFSKQKMDEFQITQLRYYGGVKWVWELLSKVLIDLRVEIPAAIKFELGIKF